MKKFFKIGEICKLFGVGPDSLRYYERIGMIKPQRGENGYRLYSAYDIWKINIICDLRRIGLSTEKIASYLENRSPQFTEDFLLKELEYITEQEEHLKNLRENILHRLGNIRHSYHMKVGVVERKRFEKRYYHEIQESYKNDDEMDILTGMLVSLNKKDLYLVGNNQIGSFVSIPKQEDLEDQQYDSAFVISEEGAKSIPGGEYISISYRGDYGQTFQYIPVLLQYAREHGLRPVGRFLELLWIDIHEAVRVEDFLTEVQIRVIEEG